LKILEVYQSPPDLAVQPAPTVAIKFAASRPSTPNAASAPAGMAVALNVTSPVLPGSISSKFEGVMLNVPLGSVWQEAQLPPEPGNAYAQLAVIVINIALA
jgi:hypothetical protein